MEKPMELPEQCKRCILQNICLEDGCIKSDPCLSKVDDGVQIDPDLLMEIKERMGI